ncbi:hypothetical protein Mapa_007834 [Marchantia paleacea]|nr:hypothetical protein Mapa_007834 [Marchantia paleacea]
MLGRQNGISLSNDNAMDATWTIATLFHALLLSLACVEGRPPRLYPTSCSHLMPKACKQIFSVDSNNRTTLRDYSELCTQHECIAIRGMGPPKNPFAYCFGNCDPDAAALDERPGEAPAHPHPHPPEVGNLSHRSIFFQLAATRFRHLSAENISLARFLDPSLFKEDSEGRVLRVSKSFWFCDGMSCSCSYPKWHNSFQKCRDRVFLIVNNKVICEHES